LVETLWQRFNSLARLWPLFVGLAMAYAISALIGQQKTTAVAGVEIQSPVASAAPQPVPNVILEKNILDLENPVESAATSGPNPGTWELLITITGTRPRAMFNINGQTVTVFQGDEVEGWKLSEVRAEKVVWRRGMEMKQVSLREGPTQTVSLVQGKRNKVAIERDSVADVISDPGEILQQARFRPKLNYDGSEYVGFSIENIQGGSILERIGLEDGDILMRMNGQTIDGPDRLMQLYSGLVSANAVTLDIKRDGSIYSIYVELK